MGKNVTFIEAAAALVGRDLRLVRDAVVEIRDGTISGVHDSAEAVAGGAERVDASGHLLIPGFIDAHVHVGLADPKDVVANGVTTVRDLAWPPDVIFDLAERSRSADFEGPTILAAGAMLTAPGGYPTRAAWAPPGTGLPVATPQEGRDAVARLARAGASVIKIALNPEVGPVLDESIVTAIVDAAHDRALKVSGHISSLVELEKALRAGIDELAHMLMSEERIPADTINRMVGREVAVVPTLSVRFGTDRQLAIENLARFTAAGGRVIYGTDLGNEGPRPGIDPLEVSALAEAGFSPRDIVRTATVDSADWIGLRDAGTIAVGAVGDLVCVPLSALEKAEDLCRVESVWRLGRRMR